MGKESVGKGSKRRDALREHIAHPYITGQHLQPPPRAQEERRAEREPEDRDDGKTCKPKD